MPLMYGRVQVPESHNTLARDLHLHTNEPLKTVDWEPPLAVIDQQDLLEQGIDCSTFIPDAMKGIDALGSCTMNATTAKLSSFLGTAEFLALPSKLPGLTLPALTRLDDTVSAEKLAIGLYHLVTWSTGVPSQEWPRVDCGSSGPYIVELLQRLQIAKGALVASGAQNIASLLQKGAVLQGTPWLNPWEEPGPDGFIDGDGTHDTLAAQIQQGVAGGHETLITAIEKIELTQTGRVISHNTVVRVRNSWSKAWGDNGSCRMHLSTLDALASYCDFRLLQ